MPSPSEIAPNLINYESMSLDLIPRNHDYGKVGHMTRRIPRSLSRFCSSSVLLQCQYGRNSRGFRSSKASQIGSRLFSEARAVVFLSCLAMLPTSTIPLSF
jgi:hypothetical protein